MRSRPKNIYDYKALRDQLAWQQKHVWDLDRDIHWDRGIDMSRGFLPLDDDYIAFPGASLEQARALSQLMGLIVNATIAEMELVANKIKDVAWRQVLRSYPVNPEMFLLGEQFFEEEQKHAELFRRFNQKFCQQNGIDEDDLKALMPQAYGAVFQKAVIKNAQSGGHAFWWVVAVVEEVSVLIFQAMMKKRRQIDPLYFEIQKKHFEEESKHTQYAFLMLELIKTRARSMKQRAHKKFDLLYSELFSTAWVLSELYKIKKARELSHKHEFFKIIASALPLMEQLPKRDLIRKLFVTAPYVSFILNHHYHPYSEQSAKEHGALAFYYPHPKRGHSGKARLIKQTTSVDEIWG